MIPLLRPEQRWECPNCLLVDVTHEAQQHTRMHNCSGLHGLSTPMVPAGTRCKVETREREDYIGTEEVQYDSEGRPIMSVVVTRDEGNDVTVYAPCATTRMEMT